jgi:hypothetical protein
MFANNDSVRNRYGYIKKFSTHNRHQLPPTYSHIKTSNSQKIPEMSTTRPPNNSTPSKLVKPYTAKCTLKTVREIRGRCFGPTGELIDKKFLIQVSECCVTREPQILEVVEEDEFNTSKCPQCWLRVRYIQRKAQQDGTEIYMFVDLPATSNSTV